MPRVLAIHMGERRIPTAVEIYRVNMPLYFLDKEKKWEAGWIFFNDLVKGYFERGIPFLNELLHYDVFVFSRIFVASDYELELFTRLLNVLRGYGKRIVYEIDDDYSNVHRKVMDGDAMVVARQADAITVTTERLGEWMRQHTGRPYHVLPNMVDPALWCEPNVPKAFDGITIGLSGSATHEQDWRVLAEPLRAVLEKHPHVRLLMAGYLPDYLRDLPNLTFAGALDYETYSRFVKQCDIIIGSVDPSDGFNQYKSPIKAIEGMMARRLLSNGRHAGAAILSTDCYIYNLVTESERTGLRVQHDARAWNDALDRVISDDALRTSLQINGYNYASTRFDMNVGVKLWAKAYTKIMQAPAFSPALPAPTR